LGYKTDVVFVSSESADRCYERVQKRIERGGRDVKRSEVFSRCERTMDYLKECIKIADTASVFDNSGKAPVPVFSKTGTKMRIMKDPSEIPWVERYASPYFRDAERTLCVRRER